MTTNISYPHGFSESVDPIDDEVSQINTQSPDAVERIDDLAATLGRDSADTLDTGDGQPDNAAVSNPRLKHADAQRSQPPGSREKDTSGPKPDNAD